MCNRGCWGGGECALGAWGGGGGRGGKGAWVSRGKGGECGLSWEGVWVGLWVGVGVGGGGGECGMGGCVGGAVGGGGTVGGGENVAWEWGHAQVCSAYIIASPPLSHNAATSRLGDSRCFFPSTRP